MRQTYYQYTMMPVIGRKYEKGVLDKAYIQDSSSLIALIGRRRIGKTFLVRQTYLGKLNFDMVGLQNGSREEQLQIFSTQLTLYSKSTLPLKFPKNWIEAFAQLSSYLENLKSKKKQVLFFDEFPWSSTAKSGFVEAFAHFWNSWASRKNIVIVICGSSASWMIDNVINAKGGLHNRITKLLRLEPFSLSETKEYLKFKKVKLNTYQIAQLYMAMGGVPYYLNEVQEGLSAAQNIDSICFSKTGILANEYQNLYAALFDNSNKHLEIVEVLARKWKGLTRKEIIELSSFTNGGALTQVLRELEESSFITSYAPINKKVRESLYRLTDEYSLFYLKFIKPNSSIKKGTWLKLSRKQTYKSWSGFAFESLCLKHIDKIKESLGISGVYSQEGSYVHHAKDGEEGFQVDLLIDRDDNCINLCEIKFYEDDFLMTKLYAETLRKRRGQVQRNLKTKKHIFITLITTYAMEDNQYSVGLVDQNIVIDDLF